MNPPSRLAACILLLAPLALLSPGCNDSVDDENDIFVTNASACHLQKITLDGVDKGDIAVGQVRKFDNVPNGAHTIQAFDESTDLQPCDSHTTDYLDGNDDDYWTIHCDCDAGR